MAEVIEGQVLVGKYRVERVLGRGGMGIVVAAHHIQLEQKVAIKFLLPDAVANADIVARFVREARAAVRIKSEHVARVSDVGTLDGGEPYMVMEYLDGSDLSAWLEQRGALPVEQAVEFVLQASEAIAEAHALGIVHRDLKPANLFVVRRADGLLSVKVLDFGISKLIAGAGPESNAGLTQTATVIGSPLYMPPEQMAASKNVDARADIWALGVILYEALLGKAPFNGDTLPEVCMKIALEPPPPMRRVRPELPQALESVVLRCLEKDRERRYSSVAELAQALVNFGPARARGSVERIARTIHAAAGSSEPLVWPPGVARSDPTIADSTAAAAALRRDSSATAQTGEPWGHTMADRAKKSRLPLVFGVALVALSSALALAYKFAWSPSLAGETASSGAGSVASNANAAPTLAPLPAAETAAPAVSPASAASTPPPEPVAEPAEVKASQRALGAKPVRPGKLKPSARAAVAAQPAAPVAAPPPLASPAPPPKAPKVDIYDDR